MVKMKKKNCTSNASTMYGYNKMKTQNPCLYFLVCCIKLLKIRNFITLIPTHIKIRECFARISCFFVDWNKHKSSFFYLFLAEIHIVENCFRIINGCRVGTDFMLTIYTTGKMVAYVIGIKNRKKTQKYLARPWLKHQCTYWTWTFLKCGQYV